ncbi:MAG: hypothetical protein ACLSH8_15595 [Zhenhengia sp.]|jgi:hypothetical protein|uniref:hypothetical protein n=1 Tax=Zhenhengia sp. TaxID=2944208 RepID=UPI00290AF0EE|nr:hypothetical protein [Clostridiales bacterium]MDU6974897.1 hypothetical protein [Clostridiales bacterium]
MKKNIIATNEWFKNRHLLKQGGWYALAIYMILQKMQQYDGKIIVSIGELIAYMMADRKNETIVQHIKDAINFLVQEKFIVLYQNIHMTQSVECDLKNTKTGQALYMRIGELPAIGYTQITVDELNTIMINPKLKAKQKAQILSYFMAIISHIDTKTKVAYPSFDTLQEEAQVGRREKCKQFNEELKDMGLLVYGNAGVANIERTGFVSNTYARAEHEVELKTELMRMRETRDWKIDEIRKYRITDMKRSLKQRINKLQQRAEQGELKMKEQRQLDRLWEHYNELSYGEEVL